MSGPLASLKTLSHSSALRPLLPTVPFPPEEWGLFPGARPSLQEA